MEEKEYRQIIKRWKEDNKQLIESGKCKKVFLEILPTKTGLGKNSEKSIIDWNKTKKYKVKGIFGNSDFEIEIIDYERNKKHRLTIKYNNKEFEMHTDVFKKCGLKNILEDVKIKPKFKYEIGQRIVDNKRDITITDRKYVLEKHKSKKCVSGYTTLCMKYYQYECNKCGFDGGKHWSSRDNIYKDEFWILEVSLFGKQKVGCSCCGGNTIVVEHINSIYKTDPWMIPYIGEECAKTHAKYSKDKVKVTCPDCGRKKSTKIAILDVYIRHNIGCSCSDFLSYSEKLIFNVLEQLKIEFKTQLNKTTFDWCKTYRYDFYFELNGKQYIIETHGKQHYEEGFEKIKSNKKVRTLVEEQENDRLKKELAIFNGIKEENYIVIDCRKSTLEWIKDNEDGILKSKLNELFDLSKIDWLKAKEFTTTNLIKTACEYKKNNPNMTCADISKVIKVGIGATTNYLKIGNDLGWCHYDTNEEQIKNNIKNGIKLKKSLSKPVEVFKEGVSLGVFISGTELSRQPKKTFGVKLNQSEISAVCLGKIKQYKGYTFKYISKEEYEQSKEKNKRI